MTHYNTIFDRLCGVGDDLEGLTAYALYKKHKRQWAAEFERDNGSPPTPADDKTFFSVASTDDQLARYRKDASDILIAFANDIVVDAKPGIQKDAVEGRIELAARRIESQGSFKKTLGYSILATAVNTLILIILAIGVRLLGIDLLDAVYNLGGGQFNDTPYMSQPVAPQP